jgi:AcrR family transcriptional regulator
MSPLIPIEPPTRLSRTAAPERADAARNRLRALEAASRLFGEQGVENVSMDAIAEAAGVGKGTLYRRFGDRAGLALALLDERERDLQERVLRGPPPLGPGAPAGERLGAFLEALADHLDAHIDLVTCSQTAALGARFRGRLYDSYHQHAAMLLRAARPDLDADHMAHALLAPLSADLHRHLRRDRDIDLARIKAGLLELVRALTGDRPPGG